MRTGPTRPSTADKHLAGDVGDGTVGRERLRVDATVAVLDHGVVVMEVERDDERARAVGRGQRCAFPSRGP